MIEKILVPTDGSVNSNIALDYAIYIALRLKAQISGLHILDVNMLQSPIFTDISGAVGIPPVDGFLTAVETSLEEKATCIMNNFSERCRKSGINPEIKKIMGKIDETIIEEAKNYDFISMAKKGEHFHLKTGGLLGSVAEAVIRNCGKPVMVTPAKYQEIESMGLAYDGSPLARKALALSLELVKLAGWPLTSVIITSDTKKADLLSAEIEESAQAVETECEIIILPGKEGEEIIKFIKEDAVELMVMGAYGHNQLRELFLGSTTSFVIEKSTIPVLLTH